MDGDFIQIGYFNNGVMTGKYIATTNWGVFIVGEYTEDANGEIHDKGMFYNPDGTTEQFSQ